MEKGNICHYILNIPLVKNVARAFRVFFVETSLIFSILVGFSVVPLCCNLLLVFCTCRCACSCSCGCGGQSAWTSIEIIYILPWHRAEGSTIFLGLCVQLIAFAIDLSRRFVIIILASWRRCTLICTSQHRAFNC